MEPSKNVYLKLFASEKNELEIGTKGVVNNPSLGVNNVMSMAIYPPLVKLLAAYLQVL